MDGVIALGGAMIIVALMILLVVWGLPSKKSKGEED